VLSLAGYRALKIAQNTSPPHLNLYFNQTVTTSLAMTTWSTQLAPPKDVDWVALGHTIERSIIEALQSDEGFTSSPNLRLQCFHACRILRLNRRPCVPYSLIGRVLGADKKTVKRHFKQHSKFPNGARNGRPPILTSAQMDELFEFIAEGYRQRSPWTIRQVKEFIARTFHVSLEKTTLGHLLERDPRFRTCPGVPMEDLRIAVTPQQIENFFREAFSVIEGVPAHFIFNMDEMGHQEWADRKQVVCVIPSFHQDNHVNVPVPRTGKRITMIACITLDGSFLKPTIIVPRKTVDTDLILTGMTSEKVTVKSQPHGFINTSIFDSWFEETFIPELRRRRETFEYAGPAVILLDNCSCHMADRFTELCRAERVIPLYFPPHSSNQLQPLDLLVFGVTKRLLTRMNRLDSINIQSAHIAQVVCAFMSAATPLNVVKTFALSGICAIADEGILRCQLQMEKARRILVPFGGLVPGCDDSSDMASDDEEIEAFREEMAELLYDIEQQ
jgi:hypothetical protein